MQYGVVHLIDWFIDEIGVCFDFAFDELFGFFEILDLESGDDAAGGDVGGCNSHLL